MGRAENLTKPNIALTQSKGNALALAHGEGTLKVFDVEHLSRACPRARGGDWYRKLQIGWTAGR